MLVMKRKKKMLLPLRIEPVLKYSWSDFPTTTPQISHCGDSDNSKQFSNGLDANVHTRRAAPQKWNGSKCN